MASQCGAASTKFLQWCFSVGENCQSFSSVIPVWDSFRWWSSVPCRCSLGRPVVSHCTLGQPVAFQWHSSVHWTSQCTLAKGKGQAYCSQNPWEAMDLVVIIIMLIDVQGWLVAVNHAYFIDYPCPIPKLRVIIKCWFTSLVCQTYFYIFAEPSYRYLNAKPWYLQ